MSAEITISGIPEVEAMLNAYGAKDAKKTLQLATQAAAKAMKPFVKAVAPKGTRAYKLKNGGTHQPGTLRRRVSARGARRQRPAAIVSARVPYRAPLQRGHRIVRNGAEIGHVPAHDFIEEGFRLGEEAAFTAAVGVLTHALTGDFTPDA